MVATDGSLAADNAVQWAAELAKAHDSVLTVCMVTSQQLTAPAAAEPERAVQDKYGQLSPGDAALSLGAEILRRAELRVKAAGVERYELCEVYGHNVAATIVQEAEARGVKHVVVGSTGKTEFTRLLLGSVSANVVRYASCPVTVVR
jgi:nucleotide-binding universal stress UspA family protein